MKSIAKRFLSTAASVLATLAILSFASNLAVGSDDTSAVDLCKTLVAGAETVLDCPDQLFGACVALFSAQRNAERKNASFSELCPPDLVSLAQCAVEPTVQQVCKCYVELNPNDCPRGAIGACISSQTAQDIAAGQAERFIGLLVGECTPLP